MISVLNAGPRSFATILAVAVLSLVPSASRSLVVPGAPPGRPVSIDSADARAVVEKVFGVVVESVEETPSTIVFITGGFRDSRMCPLAGVRDAGCEMLEWMPSRITVRRDAWEGPVSGHLSRNRIMMVDMESDSVGFAIGTMHGVLVIPSQGLSTRRLASFGWYLSRSGRSLSMSVRDVSGDGTADVVYSYSQVFPRGVVVAVQDVWTFSDMKASKFISAGEKLSGVLTSTFEGVPVFMMSDGRVERGRFVYTPPGATGVVRADGGPASLVVVERAVSTSAGTSWEFQVVGDIGAGWMDFLAVQGDPMAPVESRETAGGISPEGDFASTGRCLIQDVQGDVPVSLRRLLLDLEEACAIADSPLPGGALPVRVSAMAVRAFALAARGWPLLAAAFLESAAVELRVAGLDTAGFVLSWLAAVGMSVVDNDVCREGAGGCEAIGIGPLDGLVAGVFAGRIAMAEDLLAGLLRVISSESPVEPGD